MVHTIIQKKFTWKYILCFANRMCPKRDEKNFSNKIEKEIDERFWYLSSLGTNEIVTHPVSAKGV